MSVLRRIGGPNAISGWSYGLSMVILLVVTTLPSERDQFIGTLGQRLVLAGVGTAAGFVVLIVASLTVLHAGSRPARPWTAAGVFAVAGMVQGVAIIGLRSGMGLPPVDSTTLIVTRAVAGVVWLSVVAIVVDQARSHAARVAELQSRISVMEHVRHLEDDDLRDEVARMREQVLDPIRRALDDIGHRLGLLAHSGRALDEARALRSLVDDQVRPLSHALLGDLPMEDAPEPAAVPPARRDRLLTTWRLAVTAMARPAWLAVVLPMALILLFAIQDIGVPFLVVSAVSYVVVVGGLFAAARAVLDPRLPAMRTATAAVVVLAVYEALAVVAVVNGWAWGGLSEIGPWIEWPALVTLPVVWLALAVYQAGERERRDAEEQLEDVLEHLAVATTRRRQRIRHERQVLGRLLHGSAQATLLSVEARLAQAVDDEDPAPGVEIAAAELAALRTRLSEPSEEAWHVREALADIVGMWAGVVEVEIDARDDVLDLLDAAPATRTGVIDVVAEGITNAVRHGRARTVDVRIARRDREIVEVVVSDDGGKAQSGARGMGSEIFDEVACDWRLEVDDVGAVLTASVVLDAVAAPG